MPNSSLRRSLQFLVVSATLLIFSPLRAQQSCLNIFDHSLELHSDAFKAIEMGVVEEAALLLREPSLDINAVDAFGKSYLRAAIFQGNQRLVKQILENPATVIDGRDFIFAYERGNIPVFKTLLQYSPDSSLNAVDAYGEGLLHKIVRNRSEDYLQVVLALPAWRLSLSIVNHRGEIPIDIARAQLANLYQHPESKDYEHTIASLITIIRNLSHPPAR